MKDRELDAEAIEALKARAKSNISEERQLIDGIIDVEFYAKAYPRILWILKESVDYGDSIPLDDWMNTRFSNRDGLGHTYQMMGYVSYALLSDKEETWQSIPVEFPPDGLKGSAESLKHVAIINAKKWWGDSKSDAKEIVRGYQDHRDHIAAQVDAYKPDVVIFGYSDEYREIVADIYRNAEGQELDSGRIAQEGSLTIFKGSRHPERLYFWAYHPSYRKSDQTKGEYCMEIVRAYRQFGPKRDAMPS